MKEKIKKIILQRGRVIDQFYGFTALLCLIFSTILCFLPILMLGLLKLIPYSRWQTYCTKKIDVIVTLWCEINNAYIRKVYDITWQITGTQHFNPKQWYLVLANHQSWLDIVVLQYLFNRKIPVLKFFIKDQLKWIPLLGFSWWAMGCPFMKRYSKTYLTRKPHKKGRDLEATKKAVKRFKHTPAAIVSFVEGTRFSSEKRRLQDSPYQHLLKPKAGGVSFVISAMGEQFDSILDVTIMYSHHHPTLWNFLCRKVNHITVHIRQLKIPPSFMTESLLEGEMQEAFRGWINQTWQEKDRIIIALNNN